MSKQVEVPAGVRTFVTLICKRCGGISDGPIGERNGVCTCSDENEVHYEPDVVLRASDLGAIYKHFSDRLREQLEERLQDERGQQGEMHVWRASAFGDAIADLAERAR